MGGTLSTVQEQLQNLPGEILLTIARLKPTQNTPQVWISLSFINT